MRIFGCMACTIDGKLGPAETAHFVPITSRQDMVHLKRLRDEADGILFGAATFRAWPKVHEGHDLTLKKQHFILSQSLDLDPRAPLFEDDQSPVTIFTSSPKSLPQEFPEHVKLVHLSQSKAYVPQVMDSITALGITSLLVEGGGQVLHQMVAAEALQELYLTLSPLILGDPQAPALFGGKGFELIPSLKLLDQQQHDHEVYLHLALNYSKPIL